MQGMTFQEWLENQYQQNTVNSRLSNCQRIEQYEGNLDIHYNRNQGSDLLKLLTYTKKEKRCKQPAKHNIPIKGDIYNGTATLKQAANLYFKFKTGKPLLQSSQVIRRRKLYRPIDNERSIQVSKLESIATELNLATMPVQKLLRSYAAILAELKDRKILRSINNPVADYTEWLVAQQLNLALAKNSTSGFDARDKDGMRFQIKARRVNSGTRSVQLSAIRNLSNHPFDFLIAVIFEYDFAIRHAFKIPIDIVSKKAVFQKHTNSHIFHINKSLLADNQIDNITSSLTANKRL